MPSPRARLPDCPCSAWHVPASAPFLGPTPVCTTHPPAPPTQDAGALWGSGAGAQFALAGAASTGEVAAVILVKLVTDMYVAAGPRAAFPLALLLLQVGSGEGSWVGRGGAGSVQGRTAVFLSIFVPCPAHTCAEPCAEPCAYAALCLALPPNPSLAHPE